MFAICILCLIEMGPRNKSGFEAKSTALVDYNHNFK